jgi:hypothetical protein
VALAGNCSVIGQHQHFKPDCRDKNRAFAAESKLA